MMNKTIWKPVHNVLGLSTAVFLLLLLVSGILLNHPSLLGEGGPGIVAPDPSDPRRILFVRTDGLYQSLDGGGTLEEVPMLFPPRETSDLTFAPGNSKGVYLLERWGRLLHSADGGKVWESLPLPFDPQGQGIELKRIGAGGNGRLALLTSHGWLLSEDGGKTWDSGRFDPRSRPLRRIVHSVHTGYFFGPGFVWLYDFAAAGLGILIVSGVVLWRIGKKGL